MCSPTRCRRCGLTTWSGCGLHVAEVKATVPPERWCGGKHADDSTGPNDRTSDGGWLRRLIGG